MSANHTPGPWELHTSNSTGNVWIEDANNNCVIAPSYAFGINGLKDKQAMVNARLIAAAPILLAALEEIAASSPSDCADEHEYHQAMRNIARGAILKATGGASS